MCCGFNRLLMVNKLFTGQVLCNGSAMALGLCKTAFIHGSNLCILCVSAVTTSRWTSESAWQGADGG
jgi:hypothetical protein